MTLTADPPKPDPSPEPTRSLRQRVVVPALFVVAVLAGLALTPVVVSQFRPHAWSGTKLPSGTDAPSLAALDFDDGSTADLAEYEGDVVLVFFGYTFCPDVCPLTLSVAADAIDELGASGDDVHLLMVSLDPERDSLDQLGDYVRHFDPRFRGVGGAPTDVAGAAALYGIFFQHGEADENGFYLVDHTATLMGIGPEGNLDVVWSHDVDPDDLAADIEELLP